jgi:uncharacterized protein YndB with AHSA1/START domain
MKNYGKMTLTTQGDQEIVMTRTFDAPRRLVYDAWTKPELLKRWLGVRGGWELAVCELDLRVGGQARYVWRSSEGRSMGMTQTYLELVPHERLVAKELFDDPWYPGDAVATVELSEEAGRTTVRQIVRYASAEARAMVLKFPAIEGVAQSFDALEELLAQRPSSPKVT